MCKYRLSHPLIVLRASLQGLQRVGSAVMSVQTGAKRPRKGRRTFRLKHPERSELIFSLILAFSSPRGFKNPLLREYAIGEVLKPSLHTVTRQQHLVFL